MLSRVDYRRLKSAVAVTEQDGYKVVGTKTRNRVLGHGEIGYAVAVQVGYRHRFWRPKAPTGGKRLRGLKSAVAIAEQDTNRNGKTIGNHEVRFAVAVHVAQR